MSASSGAGRITGGVGLIVAGVLLVLLVGFDWYPLPGFLGVGIGFLVFLIGVSVLRRRSATDSRR